jgi:hypothetical protein
VVFDTERDGFVGINAMRGVSTFTRLNVIEAEHVQEKVAHNNPAVRPKTPSVANPFGRVVLCISVGVGCKGHRFA